MFLESTPEDLDAQIEAHGLEGVVVIAHPPHAMNEWLLAEAKSRPKWIVAVNIPPRTVTLGDLEPKLKEYVSQGAKLFKIHAAADGVTLGDPHYRRILSVATELGIPVIVHTGAIQIRGFYKDPELGHAEKFLRWIREFPKLRIVLAHMNFTYPEIAIQIAEDFPNIYVDTSWQPVEVIAKAVHTIGADRVLYGSDWPIGGSNIEICINRVRAACDEHLITPEQRDLVLGGSARKLLGFN